MDKEKIKEVLETYPNRREQAEALGINERTLRRWIARLRDENDDEFLERQALQNGFHPEDCDYYWAKTKEGSFLVKRKKAEEEKQNYVELVKQAFSDFEPAKYLPEPETFNLEAGMNAIPISDHHIGSNCWGKETGHNYNTDIACELLINSTHLMFKEKLQSVSDCYLLFNGDTFHINDKTNATPASKHVLDVDSRYEKVVLDGVKAIIQTVENALSFHENVLVRVNPGNHDPDSYMAIVAGLVGRYQGHDRVKIDLRPGDWGILKYYDNLIVSHHGHKVKAKDVPSKVSGTWSDLFGVTRHRYGWLGHLHHWYVIEDSGMIVEGMPTLAAPDSYARNGPWVSERMMFGLTFHPKYGEVDRKKVTLEMLNDAFKMEATKPVSYNPPPIFCR